MLNSSSESGEIHDATEGTNKITVFTTLPGLDWKLGAVYDEKKINQTADSIRTLLIIIILAIEAVVVIVLYFIISHILKPIEHLKKLMDSIAEGDLTVSSKYKI